jgi:hypothetical protein
MPGIPIQGIEAIMPGKQFRGIKAKKAIGAFERAGGVRRKKGKGDHVNIKMPNGLIITIPNKGTARLDC